MTTLLETSAARVLAACDLIAEPVASLDAQLIAGAASELIARLTICDVGMVVVHGPGGAVAAAHPRPVSDATAEKLVSRTGLAPWQILGAAEVGDTVPHANDVRAVRFEAAGRFSGLVVAVDPLRGAFAAIDEWLLMVAARQVAARFEVLALHEDRLIDEQLARDARLAGQVQREMLEVSTEAPGLDVAALARPARHVGGDLYGWHSDGAGTCFVVADVSGKGAAAALLMASVQASLRQAFASGPAWSEALLDRVNADVGPMLQRTGRITTMAAALVRPDGSLRLASAGHSPVVVRAQGETRLVLPTSPPLGFPFAHHGEQSFDLDPSGYLVIATDGLIEQRSPSGEMYGVERLVPLIDRASGSSHDVAQQIVAEVSAFAAGMPQEDDQALVVVRREVA
jgi:sigma-B regulation protein RsbU (phosphoserine phosphatase)